jgi:hypothetical protein
MALSGCTKRKLKKAKARASEADTGGIQQPGNASMLKQGKTSTETPKKPRSEDNTATKTGTHPKWLRESMEHDQDNILEELGRGVASDSNMRTTKPKILQTGGRCTDQQSGQWLIRATDNQPRIRGQTKGHGCQEPPQACQNLP